METTKGKSVPEALRMIAGWREKGRRTQYFAGGEWFDNQKEVYIPSENEYRAKPKKPQFINRGFGNFIELTPESKKPAELRASRWTVSEWISVKDRLPEPDCDYYILAHWDDGEIALWTCKKLIGGKCYVTHWMPLPEPPEVDGE